MSDDDLRVLTVRQPWAWAIVRGGKDVENRTRNVAGAYRGLVAIHVATSGGLFGDFRAILRIRADISRDELPWTDDRYGIPDAGHVIGVVDLVDVHRADLHASAARDLVAGWSPWAEQNVWHLVLANPRPLATPIPAKGQLGLWRPDEALRAGILSQVEV